jgi:hypothetical protein
MSDSNLPTAARSLRRGTAVHIATTVFIGIPMTLGLITAVAVYCTFEYAKHKLFVKAPKRVRPDARRASSEAFTASLGKMADVHRRGLTAQPAAKLEMHETVAKLRD